MSDLVVEATDVVIQFGTTMALDGFSCRIPRGTTGILGPNGAGKSTFLKALLGLLHPTSGRITTLGVDATTGPIVRRRVGFMPERDCHIPGLTALDTVAMCGELAGLPNDLAFRRAHETLTYCGLGEVRYRAVDGFSTGLRQRVKLAAALAHDPDVLVLDEPTNGLDPAGRSEFLSLVTRVASEGVSVLLSTHLLPDVEATCRDVLVVGQGRALRHDSVINLKKGADSLRRVEIDGPPAPFLDALAAHGVTARVDALNGLLIVTIPEGATNAVIISAAALTRTGIRRLEAADRSLEEVFLEAVGTAALGNGGSHASP